MKHRMEQPHPQGLLLVQNGGRRNPWPRLLNGSKKFVRISSRKHDEMSSFRLNNGFRLQETTRAAIRWKQPPKKPFHHVSRGKILHGSWSISAALARGFSDRHFERGEGPGDEVADGKQTKKFGVDCSRKCVAKANKRMIKKSFTHYLRLTRGDYLPESSGEKSLLGLQPHQSSFLQGSCCDFLLKRTCYHLVPPNLYSCLKKK